MARIRTIKPDFWTDEKIVELSFEARLFFIGSWNFADDNGNLQRSAKKLKMQIFPADAIDCEPLIQSLIAHGLFSEYEVNGEKFLHIKGFKRHQVINRPSKTGLPTPESVIPPAPLTEPSLTEGKGREGKGKEEDKTSGSVIASAESARAARDDSTVPKTHADWCRYFADEHGVELNASNVHHRNKAWPLFTAWIKAGVSIAQMDRACAKARAEAKGAIAFLPAYADTVLASMDAPARRPNPEEQRRLISEANGAAWLAQSSESDPNVIDMEQ